jgi:3-hydroxybutyryl-CoA dehydrogenase
MSIKNIGIIGSGIMGSGIAQVSAAAGYQIVIQDISKDALEKDSIYNRFEKGL